MPFLFFGAIALFSILGLAAQLWGADSRPSFIDPRSRAVEDKIA